MQNQRLSPFNQAIHRSMPSITTDIDCDSIISITSYCLRGAGNKTHYEYEVRIRTCDDRWCILRRYSRFRDLHIAMKARYKDKVCNSNSFFAFVSKEFLIPGGQYSISVETIICQYRIGGTIT